MERRLAALAADVVDNSRLIREDEAGPDLLEREQYWMDRLQCCDKERCYNIHSTAGGALGVKHRPEVRQAMSRRRKGRKRSPETKERMKVSVAKNNRPFSR